MKLVRESLNEIKRNPKSSALSSIGIGDSQLNRAYDYLLEKDPDARDIMFQTNASNSKELMDTMEFAAQHFGVPTDRVLYSPSPNISDRSIAKELFKMVKEKKSAGYAKSYETDNRTVNVETEISKENGIGYIVKSTNKPTLREKIGMSIFLIKTPKNS